MALKKGIAKVDDTELEQYVLENDKYVQNFFREKGGNMLDTLKRDFLKYVSQGQIVMLNTYTNFIGFYSWRMADEHWRLIKIM